MNNTNDKLDYLIGLAFLDRCDKDATEFEAIDDSNVVIDKKFDKRIYRLIAIKAREPKIKRMKKITFRVAIAAMLIMSIMFITIMSISGLREALWNAILKWYDEYIAITFVQSSNNVSIEKNNLNARAVSADENKEDTSSYPEEILNFKKPVVSNEYTEKEVFKDNSQYWVDYYSGETLKFSFCQNTYIKNQQYLDNTQMQAKKIFINEIEVVLFISQNKERNVITWSDGEYMYTISGYLTENELISIAKTVK